MCAFLSPSGFFWVCSMCTASLIWLAIPGTLQSSAIISLVRTCADGTICALWCARLLLVDAALVVLCLCVQAFACCARLLTCLRQALAVAAQEIFRYAYYCLCRAAELRLASSTTQTLFCPDDLFGVLASGLGYGVTSALVQFGRSLERSLGPGTVFTDSCHIMSYYHAKAILVGLMTVFHLSHSVIATRSCHLLSRGGAGAGGRSRGATSAVSSLALHLAAAGCTLWNQAPNGCTRSIPSLCVVVAGSCVWAARIVCRSLRAQNKRFTA